MSKRKNGSIVGVDLGTDSVRFVVVEPNDIDGLDIMGYASVPSNGLRKGQVVNINASAEDLKKGMQELALMGGDRKVQEIFCAISGSHIEGMTSPGEITVRNEVKEQDVARVLKVARTVKHSPGRDILHVLPSYFTIDNGPPVQTPVGHAGVRLHTDVYLVTAGRAVMDNTYTCGARGGLNVKGLAFTALAASETLLTDPEKEMGVLLVDIGAGTTDIVIWHDRAVRLVACIPLGGSLISSEVAATLATTRNEAKRVKVRFGSAAPRYVDPDEVFEVPGVGAKPPTSFARQYLAGIVERRLTEIFERIVEIVKDAGMEEYIRAMGVVLTGGVAQLADIEAFTADLLGVNVRVADMQLSVNEAVNWGGMTNLFQDPHYSVALGMTVMAYRGDFDLSASDNEDQDALPEKNKKSGGGLFDWLKRSFK